MQKVKFLQDFQGRETREVFYPKDAIVELDDGMAEQLIKDGRAVAVVTSGLWQVEQKPDATQAHYGAQVAPELRRDDEYAQEMKQPDLEPEVKPRRKRSSKHEAD